MTVKQLREILAEIDEEMTVILAANGEEVLSVALDASIKDDEATWELTLY